MNENLNLIEILKECPEGTKLYSRYLGSVEFCEITLDNYIKILDKNGYYIRFKPNGIYELSEENAEIDLFPSKEQRDWDKWQRPFINGDILVSLTGKIFIFLDITIESISNKYYCNSHIAIDKNNKNIIIDKESFGPYVDHCRYATEEEKQKLFKALEDNGYKWNPETKTLEKLKKEKFDPKTLKPFESRVLVSTFGRWIPAVFGCYNKKYAYPVIVVGGNSYTKCIPYEGNEHLIDTFNKPSEFYRYWEE